MIVSHDKALVRLKRYLSDYRSQVEKAQIAIQVLETADPQSDEFCQSLADLHVCATVLSPYSEALLEAINQFTEDTSE